MGYLPTLSPKNEFFRTSLLNKGLQFPKSLSSVLTLIYNYYNIIEELYIEKFGALHEFKFFRERKRTITS